MYILTNEGFIMDTFKTKKEATKGLLKQKHNERLYLSGNSKGKYKIKYRNYRLGFPKQNSDYVKKFFKDNDDYAKKFFKDNDEVRLFLGLDLNLKMNRWINSLVTLRNANMVINRKKYITSSIRYYNTIIVKALDESRYMKEC